MTHGLPRRVEPCSLVGEALGGLDPGRHVRQLEADRLELGQRAPEGLALEGVLERRVEGGLGDGGRLDPVRDAAGDQRLHQGAEGAFLAAQQGLLGDFAVLEDELGGVGRAVAHLLELARHLEAGGGRGRR